MFVTALLVSTVLMLATEKHRGRFLAPFDVGRSLFIAQLTVVYCTGGSLNPARSLGPCVVTRDFEGYYWYYNHNGLP
jgi:aquaporin rerated protein, other eukaryote